MGAKTAILMTVGTSLIDNILKKILEEKGSLIDSTGESLAKANANAIIDYYETYFKHLKCQLQSWNTEASFPSAEVQSFCFWLKAQPEDSIVLSHIILMPTDTDEAKICACKIKKILKDQILQSGFAKPYLPSNNVVNIPEPKHFQLRLENEQHFAEDVARFLDKLRTLIVNLKQQTIQRIVLNITGGYKGLTPFFSLLGFLEEDIEIIYQHEEANVVLRIPPLPLAWDFKLFDEYRSLLRAEGEHLTTLPPEKFQVLFERKNTGWVKNHFGKMLENIYTKDRLKRFGYGARLIRRLPENLKKVVEDRISRWEHIWIGDQIPETVEHSRGHSQRVMEYAASLLEPRFSKNQSFLSDNELFCLICCLWLHDIGHTVLNLQVDKSRTIPIALFPTLVRKFHHILSYQRIMDEVYHYLPENEREVVALISKYDRAAMPLRGNEVWKKGEDFGLTVNALEKEIMNKSLNFRGEHIDKERVLLLCALLRIIDTLDIQSDRVIDKNYWEERKLRTVEEVDYYRKLLCKRLDLLNKYSNEFQNDINEIQKQLENIYENWRKSLNSFDDWEKADKIRCNIENDVEPRLVGIIKNALSLDDKKALERELLLELLSFLDRIGFKMLQEAHFRKHSRVKLVYLTCQENPSSQDTIYRIQMVFDKDISISDDQKRKIANEIWNEIEKVKDILLKAGLHFEGIFEGEKKLFPLEEVV